MDRSLLARRAAPVAVFAAVLGGIVVVSAGRDAARREPRALPINAASGTRGSASEDRAAGAPMSAPYHWTETRIPDGLLAGLPSEGPAYELKGDTSRIAALAKALGVEGEVRRVDGAWVVGTGEQVLQVMEYPGRPWYLGAQKVGIDGREGSSGSGVAVAEPATASPNVVEPAPPASTVQPKPSEPVTDPAPGTEPGSEPGSGSSDTPVDKPMPCPTPAEPDVVCAVPVPMPAPTMPPQPSDAVARAAADKVLAAVGQTGAAVRTEPGWSGKDVTASPVVGGLPTVGYETRVTVDAEGAVVYASGFLADATPDATYPLLPPREAVTRGGVGYARDLPAIEPALLAPSATPTPVVREATAVRLGLMFMPSYEQAGPAFLVPAWLLTFEGSTWEEPYLALPDKFIATPPPVDHPEEPVCDPSPCPTKDAPPPPDAGGTDGGGSVPGSTGAPEPAKS